jgi:hypothetical protein
MARFIFNVAGRRGIHYWRQLDRYSVFLYWGGDDYDWLPGDGAPGWTGEIWFSDLTMALKARDEYRRRVTESKSRRYPHEIWLRDIEQEADW